MSDNGIEFDIGLGNETTGHSVLAASTFGAFLYVLAQQNGGKLEISDRDLRTIYSNGLILQCQTHNDKQVVTFRRDEPKETAVRALSYESLLSREDQGIHTS